jgi:flagellar biosynthesis/type III secretory pathway protein FliH
MQETTVHFSIAPVAVRVIDANGPLPDANVDSESRRLEQRAAIAQAEMARQAQEREAIERVLERINEVASQLSEQRQQLLHEMQQLSVELAIAVASQAIHMKIQAGDLPIEAMVRSAIERFEGARPIVLHLHPEDLALLQRRIGDARDPLFDGGVRFAADPSLARGDCRAESGESGVWCKMYSHLEEMRQRLLETLGDAATERRKTAADDSGLRRFPDRRQTA